MLTIKDKMDKVIRNTVFGSHIYYIPELESFMKIATSRHFAIIIPDIPLGAGALAARDNRGFWYKSLCDSVPLASDDLEKHTRMTLSKDIRNETLYKIPDRLTGGAEIYIRHRYYKDLWHKDCAMCYNQEGRCIWFIGENCNPYAILCCVIKK